MMMRSRTACLLAAALLWASSRPAAEAKPPDLPKKITITCQPQGGPVPVQVQEVTTGSLLFGIGVNSDAGLTGSIQLKPGGRRSVGGSGLLG